jgi:Sulfotransferase domain
MMVASGLVFVHIPRTGGSFVRRLLAEHVEPDPSAPRFETHASYDDLPTAFADRPAFCVVRNPWDWYVSWYHHTVAQAARLASNKASTSAKRANWESTFSSGRATFAEVVTRACEGLIDDAFATTARESDTDLYSEYVRGLAANGLDRGALEAGRFEHLRTFLVELFDRHGLLSDSLREATLQAPAVNTAGRGPYRDYYDDELRELVGHKARWLIDRFGYEF